MLAAGINPGMDFHQIFCAYLLHKDLEPIGFWQPSTGIWKNAGTLYLEKSLLMAMLTFCYFYCGVQQL